MNLYVCLKIVPDNETTSFNPETNTISRGSQTINPADLTAIEMSLEIKKQTGCHIYGVCMGPASAEKELQKVLYLGLEKIYLLSSPRFAGSDVSATAYVLSQFFQDHPYDLVICGSHSSDGNTGLLGSYLAGLLNVPHISAVNRLLRIDNEHIAIQQYYDNRYLDIEAPFPCIIIVNKDALQPHTPSLRETLEGRKRSVVTFSHENFSRLDLSRCGYTGSATHIHNIQINNTSKDTIFFSTKDLSEASAAIIKQVFQKGDNNE